MSNKINRQKRLGRYVIEEEKEEVFFYKFNKTDKLFNLIIMGDHNEYFKGNGKYTLDISELFSCALAKEVNYKIVEQFPAVFIDKNGLSYEGLVSKDYVENREKTEVVSASEVLRLYFSDAESLRKNAIENHYNAAKMFVHSFDEGETKKKLKLDENFVKDLQKLHLFNFLICAEDIWPSNMEYIIENNTLKLGTPFDFSYSFLLKRFTSNFRESFANCTTLKEKQALVTNEVGHANMPFQIFKENANNKNREVVVEEIAKVLMSDAELKQFYSQFKTVNLKHLLTEFKKQNEYEFINETDIELASLVLQSSIKQVDKALENESLLQNSPLYKITNQNSKYYNREFLTYHKKNLEKQELEN